MRYGSRAREFGRRRVAGWSMDSLRYWVTEMHIDGFRFDLATTLTRQGGGADTAQRLPYR